MPQFAAVSRERHAGKRWHRFNNYSFAAAQNVVPLFGTELSPAACSMPLAFIEQGGRYTLVALLSLMPGRNLFVAPDGRWLGGYVPSLLRAYPFGIVPKPDSNAFVLCVDEDKLASNGQAGELFFDEDGKLSPAVQPIFDNLAQLERSRIATEKAVSALAEAGLIQPWHKGTQPISGLHHIDEAALNALADEGFMKLRRDSAPCRLPMYSYRPWLKSVFSPNWQGCTRN